MISSHCFKACRPQLFQHYHYLFPPSLVIIPVLRNYSRHLKQLFPPLSAVIPAISSSFAAIISILSPINSSLPTLVPSLSAIDSSHSRYQQQSFPVSTTVIPAKAGIHFIRCRWCSRYFLGVLFFYHDYSV